MKFQEEDRKTGFPSVTIVIATLDSKSTVDDCIKSILHQDYPKDSIEVIAVDGGSQDSTVERIRAYPARVELIQTTLNAPAAYNLALKKARGEIIGLIDSDARVERQWLRKLVAQLENPKVAGASGSILTWNKGGLVPRCIGYDVNFRYQRLPSEVSRIATMNLILRKKVIEEVGGFDPNLSTQYDTDMCMRIAKSGYTIIFDQRTRCEHFHRPNLYEYFKQQLKYGENTPKLYLRHKHLIKGDRITDWWMNIQPFLYTIAALSLLIGLIAIFNLVGLLIFASLCFIMIFQYSISAAKIATTYNDPSAMFLVVIYFTRALAWTIGGAVFLFRSIVTGQDD